MAIKALGPGEVLPTEGLSTRKSQPKQSAPGRFRAINTFVDFSMHELTRAELATWLVLWRDERNGTARTSVSAIAIRAGLSRRSILTAIGGLRRRGLLDLIRQGGLNRGSSVYRTQPRQRA